MIRNRRQILFGELKVYLKMNKWEAAKFLGVPLNANETQVKEAYKRLAKKYHPDRPGGSKESFQKLQKAYDLISGKEQPPAQSQMPPHPFGGHFGGMNMGSDPFAHMFRQAQQQMGRGSQAFVFTQTTQTFQLRELLQGNVKYKDIQIPNWARDGDTVRINQSERVQVRLQWPPGVQSYKSGRNDILIKKTLSFERAILGKKFRVLHPDGRPIMVNPQSAVLSPQKTYKVDNQGLPDRSGQRGDLYLQFNIKFPDSFNPQVVAVLEKLFPQEPLQRVHHDVDVVCREV